MANPVVFFDITIGGRPAGRIEMTVRGLQALNRAVCCENTPLTAGVNRFFLCILGKSCGVSQPNEFRWFSRVFTSCLRAFAAACGCRASHC
jgi:hypothetical protein